MNLSEQYKNTNVIPRTVQVIRRSRDQDASVVMYDSVWAWLRGNNSLQ